mmetsp:Transcript_15677/g.17431  ORF Transcript_15677/g.17431 Transcript_15677/m.17431 type:complete len:448 (-) Transcript_15677:9-1352(-)
MRTSQLLSILALVAIVHSLQNAICVLRGTTNDPGIHGVVLFTEREDGMTSVSTYVRNITQNNGATLGMHVHTYGDITDNVGLSSGGHFVGSGADNHACPNSDNRHSGDMGNWNVVSGNIFQQKTLDLLPLTGPQSIVGRAVILHSQVDDCVSQPTGNAGARLAECVIGVQNAPDNDAHQPNAGNADGVCVLHGTANTPKVNGYVFFTQTSNGVEVIARVAGLRTSQLRGFHIHAYGDESSLDGTATGGHFNPLGVPHRAPPQPGHAGDLGNINYKDAYGYSWYYGVFDGTFNMTGMASIFGRGMIVHAAPDDGCSQPTGNAGPRYSQCVIGLRNPSTDVLQKPESCCPPQIGTDCVNFTLPTPSPDPDPDTCPEPRRHRHKHYYYDDYYDSEPDYYYDSYDDDHSYDYHPRSHHHRHSRRPRRRPRPRHDEVLDYDYMWEDYHYGDK